MFVGEKYGSSSFRKTLKLARISVDTAGKYRIVAKGKYCQFEETVEVKVISKYLSRLNSISSMDEVVKLSCNFAVELTLALPLVELADWWSPIEQPNNWQFTVIQVLFFSSNYHFSVLFNPT